MKIRLLKVKDSSGRVRLAIESTEGLSIIRFDKEYYHGPTYAWIMDDMWNDEYSDIVNEIISSKEIDIGEL